MFLFSLSLSLYIYIHTHRKIGHNSQCHNYLYLPNNSTIVSVTKEHIDALPEKPRDVVGDIRVCRYLRFFSGDVAKAPANHWLENHGKPIQDERWPIVGWVFQPIG
jgi:hypothetical protein